jgi:hypothetical protein
VLRARHAGSFCEGLQGNKEVSAVRSCRCEELKSKNLAVRLHVESQQSRCCLFNYMYALIVASAPPASVNSGGLRPQVAVRQSNTTETPRSVETSHLLYSSACDHLRCLSYQLRSAR